MRKIILIMLTFYAVLSSKDILIDYRIIESGMSKEELTKHKDSYFKNAVQTKSDNEFINERLLKLHYIDKLNIDLIDTFIKEGATFAHNYENNTWVDHFLMSDLVVLCSCVGVEVDSDPKNVFPSAYKYKVDSIITGNYLFPNGVEYVYSLVDFRAPEFREIIEKSNDISKRWEFSINTGDKLLLFLSKSYLVYSANDRKLKSRATASIPESHFVDSLYVYSPLYFRVYTNSSFVVKDNKLFDYKDELFKYSLPEFIKKLKHLEKLNDKENFYKRSYK